jgi:hypothetical protein
MLVEPHLLQIHVYLQIFQDVLSVYRLASIILMSQCLQITIFQYLDDIYIDVKQQKNSIIARFMVYTTRPELCVSYSKILLWVR